MSNYVKTADFAGKDGLASGTALKALKGTELGLEFDNIATMSATKVDNASNASLLNLVLTGSTVPANGVYLPAANTLGFASATTQRATVNSTGNWNLNPATSGVTATVNANVSNEGLTVQGASSGLTSPAYLTFKDFAGVARLGYVGNPGLAGGHTVLASDNGNIRLLTPIGFSPQGSLDAGATFFDLGWRDCPLNAQSANYQLVLGDRGKMIRMNGGSTVTIPANSSVAFPDGTTIVIVNNTVGSISVAITTDQLVLAGTPSTTGTRTVAQNGICTIMKAYGSTSWSASGPGVS